MKVLGPLHHFLSITVEHHKDGLILHQHTYTLDVLKHATMADCKPYTTPIDLQVKLTVDSRSPVQDTSQFCSITRALQYLTLTQPNITYTIQQICLHMHDPWELHLTIMKRIMCYFQGTQDYGVLLRCSPCSCTILQICLHMHDPWEPHLTVMKRIALTSPTPHNRFSCTWTIHESPI
jgi:hypothetical protein